jgi:hypothetical protein
MLFGWVSEVQRYLLWLGAAIILGYWLIKTVRESSFRSRVQLRARIATKEREELAPVGPNPTGALIIRYMVLAEAEGKRYRMTVPAEIWSQLAEGQVVLLQTDAKRHVTGYRSVQG